MVTYDIVPDITNETPCDEISVVAPWVLDLTGTTQGVEDSHISTSTRNNFTCILIDFMIFLFDSPDYFNLLVDYEVLQDAQEID